MNKKCFSCKEIITIDRFTDDVVFFDNHFYHEKCFNNLNKVIKSCTICKKKNIEHSKNITAENVILYDEKYYHLDCFVKHCKDKSTPKWKAAFENKATYTNNAINKLDFLVQEKENKKFNKLKSKEETKEKIDSILDESELNSFIKETYGLRILNVDGKNAIWRKLSNLYKQGVKPKYLLDMWKKKINWLNGINDRNKTRGKIFNNVERVLYDLAVLYNKYESYLEWVNKQSVLENSSQENITYNTFYTNKIKANKPIETDVNETDDINNLLDDIFN